MINLKWPGNGNTKRPKIPTTCPHCEAGESGGAMHYNHDGIPTGLCRRHPHNYPPPGAKYLARDSEGGEWWLCTPDPIGNCTAYLVADTRTFGFRNVNKCDILWEKKDG